MWDFGVCKAARQGKFAHATLCTDCIISIAHLASADRALLAALIEH
jgi:hypothetical protein